MLKEVWYLCQGGYDRMDVRIRIFSYLSTVVTFFEIKLLLGFFCGDLFSILWMGIFLGSNLGILLRLKLCQYYLQYHQIQPQKIIKNIQTKQQPPPIMFLTKNPLRLTLTLITLSYSIHSTPYLRRQLNQISHDLIQPGSLQFWLYAFFSFGLSLFAGVCSGLTVGYMSISKSEMELWAGSNDQKKKQIATTVLDILNNHHFLLSTLLLSNALALQALPIFLDKIVPAYLAIFISTAAVVIFGQVLPQAYCTGQHKTMIGYYFSPFVKFLQCIFYPFVKPIVWILDQLIEHDEGKLKLDHDKIKSLLLLHNKKQYGYRPEQIEMLQNCLDLRYLHSRDVMIPIDKVMMVEYNAKIDGNMIANMVGENNYSKIPIYENSKDKIIGFIKSKNLIEFDINNPISIKQSKILNTPIYIQENETLLDTIDILKTKKINFAIVTSGELQKCIGIITLKQIFDKIVLKKFKDTDVRVKIHLNKNVRIDSVMEAKEQD